MPYSELKKKYDVTTTGVSNDFMQDYQRSVLADRRAEPKAFDYEENRDTKHFSRSILQHRYGGQRAGRNPDMPEINTEMMDFEPRGTSDDPDMSKLVADTWAREYHLKRMLYPDKSEDFIIDAPISQWEAGPLKKAIFHNVKNRTLIFDTSYDNIQYGALPERNLHSLVNVTLADDTAYGELAKVIEGQPINHTSDMSKVAPSNTGLMHKITSDRKMNVGRYGEAPRGSNMGSTSVNHKNFQYENGISNKVGIDSFQSRASAKMYIDDVLRNVNYDGSLNESADTMNRQQASQLSDVMSNLYASSIAQMKPGESKETMTSSRPNQELRANLIKMVTEDAKLRKLYVESFNSKSPALSEFNSLMKLVLNDKKQSNRSEDQATRGRIKHTQSAFNIQHFTAGQSNVYGRKDQKSTHMYTGAGLPTHAGARKDLYAIDEKLAEKDHRDTTTFRSSDPKMVNNFLDNPDTDFSFNDHVFNKGTVSGIAKARHSKRYTTVESNGTGLEDGFGDSFGNLSDPKASSNESMTYRR
jgi:hypothetical protein